MQRRPMLLSPARRAAIAVPLRLAPLHAQHVSQFSRLAVGAAAGLLGAVLGALSSGGGRGRACEECGGAGYVPCTPCGACAGSGQRRCPRCRGGGTAVHAVAPQPIPVRVDDGFRFAVRTALIAPLISMQTSLRRRHTHFGASGA